MIWILLLSVAFNIIYCIKLLMKNEYIRRADNKAKMLIKRIDENEMMLDISHRQFSEMNNLCNAYKDECKKLNRIIEKIQMDSSKFDKG